MAPSTQRHGKMKLTQAQAEKINKILGVDFVDLEYEEDVQQYLDALWDDENLRRMFPRYTGYDVKGSVVQQTIEEAKDHLRQLFCRSDSKMLKDELPELVDEHGVDAISEVYYAVNRANEEITRGDYTWSSAVVTEFFEKCYEGTFKGGYLKHLYADDLPAIVTRNIDWGGVHEEYLENHDAIFIDGRHGELVFIFENGFNDDLYEELKHWA